MGLALSLSIHIFLNVYAALTWEERLCDLMEKALLDTSQLDIDSFLGTTQSPLLHLVINDSVCFILLVCSLILSDELVETSP